ncbi:DUF2069 domain-containing protein [Paludibacterium sp.]|uniref:DUF2069 domain-containing protein n=1 Tax=Paludibacterium sp. TaxID=1917523 RepID=UPI0025FC7E53|nr:DUF2069 domain-containing protein [Paludibacterium sp.]MBV8647054.1 DUF2069 domain-containing protein [Paludibacterium sp.]
MNRVVCHLLAVASLISLIFLSLAWELWLAPLRPGGSWLVLKAVLLLAPLFGILRGRRYTYQWASMFILLFLTEGVMRAWADHGLSQRLAWGEIVLSAVFFGAVIGYVRLSPLAAYTSSKSSAVSAK